MSASAALAGLARPAASVLLVAAVLVGCASPTSNDPSMTPTQVIGSLRTKQFRADQVSDAVFGLQGLKWHLEPALEKCRSNGGDLQVLSRTQVLFTARPNAFGAHQTKLALPEQLACRNSAGFLWGARLSYSQTTFFPSQWSGDVTYFADLQLSFSSAEQLNLVEDRRASDMAATQRHNADCTERRSAYTARIRDKPEIGMRVAFGTIIDIRLPMVLVQYDALGRQVKGLSQEWVQVSSLSAGTNCP